MGSSLISDRLLDYMEEYNGITTQTKRELTEGTIEIVGNFFYNLFVPNSWHLKDIERIDNHELIFYWTSSTEQAVCPECKTDSCNRYKRYKTRSIQDLPISGMTVYHKIKANRYCCDNPKCSSMTFVEQFEEMVDKDARLSNRLKDFIVREAIESSCNGTANALKEIGVKVSKDTVNREVKKKAAAVVEQNLKRDDVKVLSVDDINLKKGNSSTACSVFIDAQTHRVLAIVQGATGDKAEKVIKQYPCVDIVSRDRGSAYATAAKRCNKTQVADGFHLMQNIHKVIKDALSIEVGRDLFVREGNGWIRMVDSACEIPEADTSSDQDTDNCLVFIGPATLTTEDIERRIQLAGLTTRQANKYKKTLNILELTEGGLRTPEIAKRLSMKTLTVSNYRKDAPKTIKNVELKIDEYYQMHKKSQWEYHQKTIAKNGKPSSDSIVEPYKETVLRMFNEGKNHRNIHPVIVQEGFKGSANAVYQYLIKYAHENNIPYGRNSRVIPVEERTDKVLPRPAKISINRTSKGTIYQSILSEAATKREELKQSLMGIEEISKDNKDNNKKENTAKSSNKTNYAGSIAEIILDTKSKKKKQTKKLSEEAFGRIKNTFNCIPHLLTFLVTFYDIFLSLDVTKLDRFICEYKKDSIEAIATFASGLEKDYDAVKNSLLYPQISNGPMEGTNNKIKMIRRRGYGRAGIELLNALVVLPWYYKDIDEKRKLQNNSAA